MSPHPLRDQLVEFYWSYDRYQGTRLTAAQVQNTIGVLLDKGRYVTTHGPEGDLLGYVESWRITYEQFGRLLCHEPFDVGVEDIQTGPICYVANTTIHPHYLASWVYKDLKRQFFAQNQDARYFVGEALRKPTQPVKVFRADALSAVTHQEELVHG